MFSKARFRLHITPAIYQNDIEGSKNASGLPRLSGLQDLVRVSTNSILSNLTDSIFAQVTTTNPNFADYAIVIRALLTFRASLMIIVCLAFVYTCRSLPLFGWVAEQRVILALLIAVIFFENPLYALQTLNPEPCLFFLDVLFRTTSVHFGLFIQPSRDFVELHVHAARRPQLKGWSFYAPKLLVVGIINVRLLVSALGYTIIL